MKGTKTLLLAILCLYLTSGVDAQSAKLLPKSALIEPFRLEVACTKTTHLVFPFSIVSVDRGSENILAQKAAGVENILRVKAGAKNFEQTSLGVITSDGRLYSFLVDFCPTPTSLNINLGRIMDQPLQGASPIESSIPQSSIQNEASLLSLVKKAQEAKGNIRVRSKKLGMSLEADGLYVAGGIMLVRLRLQNSSVINYDIDQFRLYIRDKKVGKRTALQERELQTLYRAGDTALCEQKSGHSIILVLPKFTIPDGKFLAIEITEQNGGRNLYLKLKNKHVLKAKPLD